MKVACLSVCRRVCACRCQKTDHQIGESDKKGISEGGTTAVVPSTRRNEHQRRRRGVRRAAGPGRRGGGHGGIGGARRHRRRRRCKAAARVAAARGHVNPFRYEREGQRDGGGLQGSGTEYILFSL